MTIDIEKRAEKAMEYFAKGYNCCQSVVMAYSDITTLDNETLATISAPFGGGMGQLREVCGAATGMFIISGFIVKASNPSDKEAKKQNYKCVQLLAEEFKKSNGSIICRELLGLTANDNITTKKRPCKELVAEAAKIVGTLINH